MQYRQEDLEPTMSRLLWLILALFITVMLDQSEGCNFSSCSERNCAVSSWSSWDSCSQSACGTGGTQRRTRKVTRRATCGGTCSHDLSQTRSCNTECPRGVKATLISRLFLSDKPKGDN